MRECVYAHWLVHSLTQRERWNSKRGLKLQFEIPRLTPELVSALEEEEVSFPSSFSFFLIQPLA